MYHIDFCKGPALQFIVVDDEDNIVMMVEVHDLNYLKKIINNNVHHNVDLESYDSLIKEHSNVDYENR